MLSINEIKLNFSFDLVFTFTVFSDPLWLVDIVLKIICIRYVFMENVGTEENKQEMRSIITEVLSYRPLQICKTFIARIKMLVF